VTEEGLTEVPDEPIPGEWLLFYLDSSGGHLVQCPQRYGPDPSVIRSFHICEKVTPSPQQRFVRYASHTTEFIKDLVESLAQRHSHLVGVGHYERRKPREKASEDLN
jgi:hypothetical protein